MSERQAELAAKARRAIEAARLDAAGGHADFATARAYFACFYAAQAALLERNLSFSSHSAVIAAFGKEFARTGALPGRFHAVLREQFDDRNVSDYGTGQGPSAEDAARSIAAAEEFVAAVEKLLKQGGK